jgi:DNA-binding HxlR family transcriptional regulator
MARSYREFCSIARALDVLGERWALLVIRELLLGPRRYTDLLDALPGIGTNVLAARLRDLESASLIRRRRLPPPTRVAVYELTDSGSSLRPVIDEISRWGNRYLDQPTRDDAVEPRWLLGTLAASMPVADELAAATFAVRVGDEAYGFIAEHRRWNVSYTLPTRPTATIEIDLLTLFELSTGRQGTEDAEARTRITGDRGAAKQLLRAFSAVLRPAE